MSKFAELHHVAEDLVTNSVGAIALAHLKQVNRPDECEEGDIETVIDRAAGLIEGVFLKLWRAHADDIKEERAVNEAIRAELKEAQAIIIRFEAAYHDATKNDVHPINAPATREAVFGLTGGVCTYCGVSLAPLGTDSNSFCVEHVVPKSKGGPDNLSNYVPACCACNIAKRDRHVIDFVRAVLPKRIVRVEAAE